MNRYVCIHGHFYQPPRENPWLEAIELQESAHPYHDWNERVNAECYAPNAASRILDSQGNIARIVNNYARMSFNFGPTLLSWMEQKAPETYAAILEADRESRTHFGGHGSALAQCYNHLIMPLASRRDKQTQIAWGVADFRSRFGREPEGMWLPETAVDLETLDLLAEQGIRFTILAPTQAARVRPIGATEWQDVEGGTIDTTRAYLQRLSSGRSIHLFFYDGGLSQAVAFERLLDNGATFSGRITGVLSDSKPGPQLVHLATDGESYGHHHRFGDMALAFALEQISQTDGVALTNYGEFLARHPARHEVEIKERTSWSCAHGIDRWRADCGCHTGAHADWNQKWRKPLRESLDWLSGRLAALFETAGRELFCDPWAAREAYIEILLNRAPEHVHDVLQQHAAGARTEGADVLRLKLLELQRHAQLMFTSCGWFFDDLAGIETVQILQYAGRALQLAALFAGGELEEQFLTRLAAAKSNRPGTPDGRKLYNDAVQPGRIDLLQVGAHYAVSTLIEDLPPVAHLYAYEATRLEHETHNRGRTRLILGRARIQSMVTWDTVEIGYAALHLGEHYISGGVLRLHNLEPYRAAAEAVRRAFPDGTPALLLPLLTAQFPDRGFTLKSLFEDEQRKFVDLVLADHLTRADEAYLKIYRDNEDLMRFMRDLDLALPEDLKLAAQRALVHQLRFAIVSSKLNEDQIVQLLERAESEGVLLDHTSLAYALQERMEEMARRLERKPEDLETLRELASAVALIAHLPFVVDLWRVQNAYYRLSTEHAEAFEKKAASGDPAAVEWTGRLADLGAKLRVRPN